MEFRSNQPIYLQIADYISENILLGRWREQDKIPSIRELAVDMEVNPNTVMRVYTYLQERDIIYNRRGIGYFVAAGAVKRTRAQKKRDFIDQELPHLFKTMDLISMTFDDLQKLYNQYKSKQK